MSYTYATVFLISLLMARALSPFVAHLALGLGAVALPGDRNIHRGIVPRLGGLAVVAGMLAPLLLLLMVDNEVASRFRGAWRPLTGLGAGLFIMLALGIYDDLHGASARLKFPAQLAAAGIAYAAGCRIDVLSNPFVGEDLHLGWAAFPLTLVWFVLVTNAINLIDGLDGLAAGISGFVAAALFVLATTNSHLAVAVTALALCGALVGFLRYNFPPASIFLGDTGSLSIGYLIAGLSVLGAYKSSTAVALFVPVVVLGVPLFDTFTSFWRRVLRWAHPFRADAEHIHHRFLARGFSHTTATLALYGVTLVLVILALAVAWFDSRGSLRSMGWTLFVTAAFLLSVGGLLGYLNVAEVRLHAISGARNRARQRVRERVLESFRIVEVASEDELWEQLFDHLVQLGFPSLRLHRAGRDDLVHRERDRLHLDAACHHARVVVWEGEVLAQIAVARQGNAAARASDREAIDELMASFQARLALTRQNVTTAR